MKLPKGGWKGELPQELVLEKPSAKATHCRIGGLEKPPTLPELGMQKQIEQ